MNNNNQDRFEVSNNRLSFEENESNFFLSESIAKPNFQEITEPARRLNDYDFNLLREDAYKDVSDDLFKLEYKIARVEEEIESLDAQIQAANDIQDYELAGELSGRLLIMKEDYEALVAMYKEKSISARLTNVFGEKLKPTLTGIQKNITDFSEKLLSKLPKKFSSVLELKKSLSKLENINRSVDELISMNIPYGENIDKYEQLSKYIIKANSIQNELSRFIK
ncbi:MAG: hypothetical protein NC408_05810 [Candidatus Gastranaerophilales bacterium]|nr:hypothetical protein [Candidatus Gastranaerophilales bacterium]MCM1073844.1 hypothetical protein [Bacteroides sp.]